MPLYEYECARCGRRFELLQKFSDPPTATCACGGAAHRQLSAPAIQFKGSGFYATDYARKSAPADKSDGKGTESKSEPTPKSEEKKPSTAPASTD
jgi:putative FmdB family regulatory protein